MLQSIADPQDLDFSDPRLDHIDRVLQGYVDREELGGVIGLIARHGDVAYCKSFGWQDREAEVPMTTDAIFRIYSMTKPITSVAAMMLYEEGRFQLDDPVAKYVREFAGTQVLVESEDGETELVEPERPITVWNLFTHTAGLTYGWEQTAVDRLYQEGDLLHRNEPLAEKMAQLGKLPLLYQPGTVWHYSVATDVLGYLVQVIADQPFENFLQERIFAPLGMEDTGFYVPETKQGRLTAVYKLNQEGAVVRRGGPDDPDSPQTWMLAMREPPAFPSGGGGLASKIEDYLRFCEMLRRGGELDGVRLLGPKTVDFMTSNHLPPRMQRPDRAGRGFGLGFEVMLDPALAHIPGSPGLYRWSGAASTDFWIDPQEDLVAILMTQFMPNNYYPIARQFRVLTYQALVE